MPSPFPGMDPYLEQSAFWSSFHSRLIVAIADALAPQLRPHYYVEVETRTYTDTSNGELFVGIPDAVVLAGAAQRKSEKTRLELTARTAERLQPQTVTLPMPIDIKERYLEVREVGSNVVITVLEVFSPTNKRRGKGRKLYEEKRQKILSSASHLIEIDLLQSDEPMPMQGITQFAHYHVLVSRAEQRPQANLYAVTVRDLLPEFPLPLKSLDEAIMVNLQSIFSGVYDRASYDLPIDYTQPPPTKFSEVDQAWIDSLLKAS